jgi:hypothetical protein
MHDARQASRIGLGTVLAAMVVASACYRPHITDGGYLCAPLPNKQCPDGFLCDPGTNTCRHQISSDAATPDLPKDIHPETLPSDPKGDQMEAMCIQPRPNCAPQGGGRSCDPYCQSGCAGCDQRCIVNSAGSPTCSQPLPGNLPVGVSCDIASAGSPAQTDSCAAGLVCLHEGCGMHCFQYCRTDDDCPGSSCSRPAAKSGNPGGFKVCEVPFRTCDPVNTLASGCPLMGQTCYLSAVVPDKTFCDCPDGDKRELDSCEETQDCFPGLTCIDASNTGDLRCRATCGIAQSNPCDGGATCRPINGSTVYGFCL